MVATCRQRHDTRIAELPKERLDLRVCRFEVVEVHDLDVSDIDDPTDVEGVDASYRVDRPYLTGLIPQLARTVAGSRAIRDTGVERHADDTDVDAVERRRQGRSQKRRHAQVPGTVHRVAHLAGDR